VVQSAMSFLQILWSKSLRRKGGIRDTDLIGRVRRLDLRGESRSFWSRVSMKMC
jgi:hypothetical protein